MLAIVVGPGCVVLVSTKGPVGDLGAASMWMFTTRIVATASIIVVPIAKGLRLGDVALRVDVHCREAFCSLMRDALASIEDVPPFLPYVSKVLPC